MSTLEQRYTLAVTLGQLEQLKLLLEAASAGEADPDAPVFELLDLVRKARTEAILLKQSTPPQ